MSASLPANSGPQTTSQLIHQLQVFAPTCQVRLALFPEFPFTHRIGHLVEHRTATGTTIYLAQATQEGYLPTPVRITLRWPPR